MAFNKRDLVKSELVSLLREPTQIVDTVISEIKNSVKSGEDVMISGFSTFQIKTKNARNGTNSKWKKQDLRIRPADIIA